MNKHGEEVLGEYSYSYSLGGNQISKTENENTTTYEYDRYSRLTVEDDEKYNRAEYSYAVYGNRSEMQVTPNGVQIERPYHVAYEYDDSNRLLKETKIEQHTTETTLYHYDKNGNQLHKETSREGEPVPGQKGRIGFVTHSTSPGMATINLREYNGLGQLLWHSRDAEESRYWVSPSELGRQVQNSNAVVLEYIWGHADKGQLGMHYITIAIGIIMYTIYITMVNPMKHMRVWMRYMRLLTIPV